MSVLARAIATNQWELAAFCLLLGLAEMLSRIPSDSVEGVIDMLEGDGGEKRG